MPATLGSGEEGCGNVPGSDLEQEYEHEVIATTVNRASDIGFDRLVATVVASQDRKQIWVLAALCHYHLQEFELALYLYNLEAQLQITQKCELHVNVADTYHDIADVFSKQGNHAKASAQLQKVLTIRKSLFAQDQTDVELMAALHSTYRSVASMLNTEGKDEEAITQLTDMLTLFDQEASGSEYANSYIIADGLSTIAKIHEQQSRFGEALVFFTRSRDVSEAAYGASHEDVARANQAMDRVRATLEAEATTGP
jgi:tetratricopeptide (TPR) repeat protein